MPPRIFLMLNTCSPKVELMDLAKSAEQCFSANQVEVKQFWIPKKPGKELCIVGVYYGR
jgi:23S rRNA (cytosine1962-C5)-methyltransferase